MDAVLVEPKNKRDWDEFVQRSQNVIAWHAYHWSDLLAKYYGAHFYPLAVYDGSKISGILPLYRIRTLRGGDALTSIPHFVAGGIAAEDPSVQQALLDGAVRISKQLKISRITLKQYKFKVSGPLSTDENYYNRELRMSPDIDLLWRSISGTNREKVEEALKYESVLEYPSTDVPTFYRFLLHDQHAAGVPCVSKSWIEALFSTGAYEIALLRHKGELVAATMAKKFRDTVSFPFSCLSDQDEKTTLFAYSLYWQLMTRLAKEGIRISHSGRIPKTDAAFGYRLGWGGTKYSYYYQYYGETNQNTEFETKRGSKRQMVESVWRKLPLGVAQVLGPVIVKQFP